MRRDRHQHIDMRRREAADLFVLRRVRGAELDHTGGDEDAPPTGPAPPAAKTPAGPRADITDVTGAIKADPRPVTTSNMPKVGIP